MRAVSLVLLLALGCAGGPESSPAELALATAAPEEYATWRTARAALEAARAEAGAAVEVSRETGLAAQEDAERAEEARDAAIARAESELAAEMERLNAREATAMRPATAEAEAGMAAVLEAAFQKAERDTGVDFRPCAPLDDPFEYDPFFFDRQIGERRGCEAYNRRAARLDRDAGMRTVDIGFEEMRWLEVLIRQSKRGWPPIPARAYVDATGRRYRDERTKVFAHVFAVQREAEVERTAAREAAEAAKAEAQRVYEAAAADAVARYEATLTPSVEAFIAASRSANAAEGRLERAAPEAWAAFVAAREAER